MSHMVTFQTEDGKESFHMVEGLNEAVRLIEDLRNGEGAGEAHLYEVEEVPIHFHAYYRVEVSTATETTFDPADAAPGHPLPVTVVDAMPEPPTVDMDQPVPPESPQEVAESPTFGIFSRP